MKKKKISLSLNKEVIDQLDKIQMSQVKGGDDFTTLWGSNCNNSNPAEHQCCVPDTTDQTTGACVSYTTITDTTPGSCCNC